MEESAKPQVTEETSSNPQVDDFILDAQDAYFEVQVTRFIS